MRPNWAWRAGRRRRCKVARGQGFTRPRAPVQLGDSSVHFLVGLAPRLDVGVEGAAAENQVEGIRVR